MSGPFGSSQWMYSSGAEFYPFKIDQSLRFNDNDSPRLVWTPSSDGDRLTWTFSFWTKRTDLGAVDGIFSAATSITNNTTLRWHDTNGLQLYHYDSGSLAFNKITAPIFRDTSSWYHFVVVYDSTEATASDRVKMWVNGEAITSWYTDNNPSLNKISDFGLSGRPHYIGSIYSSSNCLDGYMAEINFVDGQALTPTDFGETKSGVWIPKEYTGSYGTNGFYLSFADSANIGDDLSGNGNDWTANNLVATDVVLDSPTNNFATLNVLTKGTSNLTLTEGNLKANAVASGSGSNWGTVFSSHTLPSTGKYYVEGLAFINAGVGNNSHLGILDTSSFQPSHNNITYAYTTGEGFDGVYVSLFNNYAQPVSDGVLGTAEGSLTDTTVLVMLAVDVDNGKVWAGYNGTWLNSGNPAAGTNPIATRTFSSNDAIAVGIAYTASNAQGMFANFGQDSSFAGNKTAQGNTDANGVGDFYYAPPSGYLALCTANLPDPVIDPAQDDVPSDYFNTVLYTGNGSTNAITGVGFQPDLVWTKLRSQAGSHSLADVIRGGTAVLRSDLTDAEVTRANHIQSFDTDGFTLGADGTSNLNGTTNVAWNWLAGNGTSSNTDGSITSTVSVNQKAGFSIVSYTGTGSSATVGHGLGAVPAVIIVKNRDDTDSWNVYHHENTSAPETDFLILDSTNATSDGAGKWNDTAPTSSVFTIGSSLSTNTSGDSMIAYCFAEVEGYSKFGSYTGNGSTDGPFVYCGFRPAWVVVKRTDSAESWVVEDATREPYNDGISNRLILNRSDAEYNDAFPTDFLSNGFKQRNTGTSKNASGSTYIFMAFAETPFRYSNAR